MPKIMLVEDDTNLSEIYEARLRAEGYDIVATKDGEEALASAVKEHPDLIICDVMMPKISGFEMLDILRGTEGIKSTKVIMMTALSQAEDKARASSLGADRYLVKSQVTLEDVVKVAKDVLEEMKPAATPTATATPPAAPANPANTSATPVTPPATPAATPGGSPLSPPTTTPQTTPATTPIAPVPEDIAKTMTEPVSDTAASTPPVSTPTAIASTPPLSVPVTLAPPEQPAPATSPTPTSAPADQATPPVTTTSADDTRTNTAEVSVKTAEGLTSEQEQAAVGEQIKNFVGEQPVPEPSAGESLEIQPTTPSAPDVPSVPKDTTPAPSVTPAPAPTTTENTDTPLSVPVTLAPPEQPAPATPTEPATAPSLGPEPTEDAEEPAPAVPANDGVAIPGKKVIQPINDLNQKPDLDALLMKEQFAEQQRALTSSGPNGAVVSDQTAPKETQPGGYLQPAPADVAGVTDPNNITL